MNTKQTNRNLWMFPLGTVGRDMIYCLFSNFLLTYVMFTRTLTAAQLSALTAIMVAARVFDALNDPIIHLESCPNDPADRVRQHLYTAHIGKVLRTV